MRSGQGKVRQKGTGSRREQGVSYVRCGEIVGEKENSWYRGIEAQGCKGTGVQEYKRYRSTET
jgi:hypothetical protein